MVKLKKYNGFFKLFVIFLTVFVICSCNRKNYNLTIINAKQIPVTDQIKENQDIESFISPYRQHINKDLSHVLAFSPYTLDKSIGKWQSNIGNLIADVSFENANKIFQMREKKEIDLCFLNHGGIRSILAKGNVTTRTAFEIMPFENSLLVLELKGEQIQEIVSYIISEKVPHPLSGMTFTITKDNTAKDILIKGKPLEYNKIYYVATNDYLANGGDNMNFFLKRIKVYDLDYKLRNVLLDYFKTIDTIPLINDVRIKEE